MMLRKLFKVIGILFLLLIVLLVGATFFTQTATFKNILRNTAENIVSSATGQTFRIGEVRGNFYNKILLKDVSLEVDDKEFVEFKELLVQFSLLELLDSSMLFNKTVLLRQVAVNGLDINLVRFEDGRWIFNDIGSGEKKEKPEKKTEGEPKWSILLDDFVLNEANINLTDIKKNESMTFEIPDIELSLKMINISKNIELDLKNADFNAPTQRINISSFSTKANYSETEASIENLKFILNGAEIELDANVVDLKETPKFNFNAQVKDYVFEKIGKFNGVVEGEGEYHSPENIKLNSKIQMPDSVIFDKNVSASIENLELNGPDLAISGGLIDTDFGKLNLNGTAKLNRIITKEGNNSFDLNVVLKDIETNQVMALIEQKTNKKTDAVNTKLGATLNADLNTKGSWIEPGDIRVEGLINSLTLSDEGAGELSLDGTTQVTRRDLTLDINTKLNKLDLGTILAKDNFDSSISADYKVTGKIPFEGSIVSGLDLNLDGKIDASEIFGIEINNGETDIAYKNEILTINALEINTDKFTLETKGRGKGQETDFTYDLEVNDLGLLREIKENLDVQGSLTATGQVTGKISEPEITVDATAKDFAFGEKIKANTLELEGDLSLVPKNLIINANADLKELTINDIPYEGASVRAKTQDQVLSIDLDIVENEETGYELSSDITGLTDKVKTIRVNKLRLDILNTEAENKNPINLRISPDKIRIESLNLYQNQSSLVADADINLKGNVDANIALKDFNLSDLADALQMKNPLAGSLNGTVNLNGSAANPQLSAKLRGTNLSYQTFDYGELDLNLNYQNTLMNIAFSITENSNEILKLTGTSNIDLSLNKPPKELGKSNLNLSLYSSGVDLSPIEGLVDEVDNLDGSLKVDLKVYGELSSPQATGTLSVTDTVLKLKSLRNSVTIKDAKLDMKGRSGALNKLELETKEGTGSFQGTIDLSTLKYDVTGTMDDLIIEPKKISAKLRGNVKIEGEKEKIKLSGKAVVRRGRIHIPDVPQKQVEDIKFDDAGDQNEIEIGTEPENDGYFYNNMALDLNVRMRGNTWVRGRGANIELKGDLDVKKDFRDPVHLSGNIDTERGTYETFGKLFRIEEGAVNFTGGDKINPLLDIKALYEVSDVKVYINISGRVDAPKVEFTSDPAMTETDIISYLVFGVSSDKIGSNDRDSVQNVTTGLASGLAVRELEKLMGGKLSLDVVSVTGGTGGPNIELGKYLTDDLYIAYERGTTESILNSTNITQNKVLVEYRLFKFLTIDGDIGGENPGVDVFYNHNFNF